MRRKYNAGCCQIGSDPVWSAEEDGPVGDTEREWLCYVNSCWRYTVTRVANACWRALVYIVQYVADILFGKDAARMEYAPTFVGGCF